MIIIKKKNIKIIIWKKIFKINKNYLKNFKTVLEIKNLKKKNNIIIFNPLSGSHHVLGIYKSNIKNIGWWNKILNNFKNFKIISLDDFFSSYGSNPKINYIKNFNIILNNKNILKLKKNILKKLNIKKTYLIIGGSLGGLKCFIFNLKYMKKIKFFLYIAFSKISLKNKIKDIFNLNILNNIKKYKKFFNDFCNLKSLKISRLLNNLNYLSKYDIKNKKKKIIKKSYTFKIDKIKILKYFYFQSNKFIKYFNIDSYIKIIKNIKNNIFFIKKNKKNKNKIVIIVFKNDIKYSVKNIKKIIIYNLKIKKKIFLKKIISGLGHDIFLKNDENYKNFLKFFQSDKIWTYDHLIPNQARWTATLHSAINQN